MFLRCSMQHMHLDHRDAWAIFLGIHALGTTRSSPNSVLQCLGRIASNSTDYPISDTTPTRREDQVYTTVLQKLLLLFMFSMVVAAA